MQTQEQAELPTDKNYRRRGRPAGKNRVPLSLEERRARNAQYEKERRDETAEAMAQLAKATCCDPLISHPLLLATVIKRLQSAQKKKSHTSIEDLKRINKKLESQIAELQSRLESNTESQVNVPSIDSDGSTTSKSESSSDTESSRDQRPSKYRKRAKENSVHDRSKPRPSSLASSRHSISSSDSQDSTWSYHRLGKAVPSQELLRPMCDVQQFTNSVSSLQRTSTSSETNQSTPEKEFYTERSCKSEAYSTPAMKQDDIKIKYQTPEQVQIKIEQSGPDQPKMSYMDPFTDREKGILEKLGCSDYINFEEHHDGVQSSLTWTPDCDSYLTGHLRPHL